MPRKSCCCGGGNYIAIPCRAWGHAVFVGYQGLTGIQGASGMLGYDDYFGATATALFKNPNSIFGLSGPFAGQHPFYKFYAGGFVVGNAGFGSPTPAPLKIAGFTGCTDTGPGGQNWGGYNGTTCYEAIFVTDNDRPVHYKLWGAGGGGISTILYGGNGAFTQVPGVYNENNIACVGFGGFGNDMVKNFTGWTGILPTYSGGGGQGYPAWGGGAAFVSVSSFDPEDNVAVVGAGGGAGELVPGPGHGGALAGKDATPPEGGKGAVDVAAGFGGCGAQSGIFYSGGRGSKSSTGAIFYGGGGGGGGLGGGGGGGITGYAGGGGSSEVTEWARSGTDQGPPNICDPYFWIGATDLASSVGGKIFGGFGGYVSGRVPAAGIPENRAEFGMSGKVAVVYSSMKCVCDETLDTIPEQTYICLNQNQYDTIIQQARGSSACYGSTISFGGATGLSAFGGLTSGFLQWTFGEGGDVPKMISFYYGAELYYLLGQCSSLCDPAYQVPEDVALTLADCREYGACCQARLARPYCKIPTGGPGVECFDVAFQCPVDCQPVIDKPSPFYICETNEENVDIPDGVFWTKKNGYYYIVAPTQGWIPFGEQLYPTEIITDIILQEPCCSLEQEGCQGEQGPPTGPQQCCVVIDNQFNDPHPGKANVNVSIAFKGSPYGAGLFGDCDEYPACCVRPINHSDTLSGSNIKRGEQNLFPPVAVTNLVDIDPPDGICETVTECDLTNQFRSILFDLDIVFDIYDESGESTNSFIPIIKIESSCNCPFGCSIPQIIVDNYSDCEGYNNYGLPVVVLRRGSVDDLVNKLNSLSNGRYTVSKLSNENFWFGYRSEECDIPGDEINVEPISVVTDPTNGKTTCTQLILARSPFAGVFVRTCGASINNCDCFLKPSPGFRQSDGVINPLYQSDISSGRACAVLQSYRRLIDWQINPSITPLLSSDVGPLCGGGFGQCQGTYQVTSCVLDDFDGSVCTFTAIGG
jgi:hypothetical protein